MATIIDSFIMQMGIDPAGVTKGAAVVRDDFKRVRDEADSSAKRIEASGARAANFLGSMKNEVIGLFVAFAGAKGLTDFASSIISNDANVGRFSKNIGLATEKIGAWQVAVREMGGSNADAEGALGTMAKAMSDAKLGLRPDNAGVLASLGVNQDNMKDPSEMLLRIADASKRMDPTVFANLAGRLGFTPPMVALLERGGQELEQNMPRWEKMAALTDADAKAAAKLQAKLADLSTIIQGKARPYVSGLADDLGDLLTNTNESKKAVNEMTPILVGLALAASIAGAPFIALAAGLIAVAANWKTLKAEWSGFEDWWKKLEASTEAPGQFNKGLNHLRDLLGVHKAGTKTGAQEAHDAIQASIDADSKMPDASPDAAVPVLGTKAASPASRALGGSVAARLAERFTARGASSAAADGIAAGILAEGGKWNTQNRVGAFGIGQWLGPRKKALFDKYGSHPSLHQQIDFLWSELKGGDAGGRPVLAATDANSALLAYVFKFMRPQGAHNEHLADAIKEMGRGRSYLASLDVARMAAGGPRGGGSGTTINFGDIIVNPPSGDPKQIANHLATSIKKRLRGTQADGAFN